MPLKIGNKTYRSDEIYLLQQVFMAAYSLPEPKINDQPITDPKSIAFALEQEVSYAKEGVSGGGMNYLGTKELAQCVCLYLHNDKEHLIIHVNHSHEIDINSLINQFENKENLKASLIGGAFDDDLSPFSQSYIAQILTELINCSETITLESQKILEHNRPDASDVKMKLRDGVITHVKMLYQKMFNENMPLAMLDGLNITDFDKEKLNYDPSIIKKYAKLVSLDQLATAESHQLLLTEKANLSKEDFVNILDALFSKQGFKALAGDNPEEYLYPGLRNIAFNMQTGELHKISEHMPTPNELLRKAYIYDPNREQTYFQAYDGNQYHKPELHPSFVQNIRELKPRIQEGILEPKLVSDIKNAIVETAQYQIQPFAALVASLGHEIEPSLTSSPMRLSTSSLTKPDAISAARPSTQK